MTLAVGIRNSLDKSFPLGFIAGSGSSSATTSPSDRSSLVKRKHTRFGETRFGEAIAQAVQTLGQFKEQESARIQRLQIRELDDTEAESYMLRAFERGVVSHRPGCRRHPRVAEPSPTRSSAELKNASGVCSTPSPRR